LFIRNQKQQYKKKRLQQTNATAHLVRSRCKLREGIPNAFSFYYAAKSGIARVIAASMHSKYYIVQHRRHIHSSLKHCHC